MQSLGRVGGLRIGSNHGVVKEGVLSGEGVEDEAGVGEVAGR